MSFDGAEHESGVRFWPDSPDSLDGVDVENSLVADQGKVLALRLGNQHPVKWIAMLARKTPSPLRMLNRNRQRVKSKLLDDPAKVSNQSLSRWKLPKTVLRGDFPSGSGGDEHFVGKGREKRVRPLGKPTVSCYRPQQRVRIDQDAHQWPQASSSSSGSGFEKSRGTVNWPLKRSQPLRPFH